MISLPDRAAVAHAITSLLQPRLRELLTERLTVSDANDVAVMTHYLVVQPHDTEADIVEAVGLSPLTNPVDGHRSGADAFQPWWDWLADLNGWFELIVTIGDSGFAYVFLIEDAEGTLRELLAMCRRYAGESTCA